MTLFTKRAVDIFAPVDAAGKLRQVNNGETQTWGAEVERAVRAAVMAGALVYATRADLDADLDHDAGTGAWVVGDPLSTSNGIYQKQGEAGTGGWSKIADLPEGAPGSSDVVGSSDSSVTIGAGAKNFVVAEPARGWATGARLRVSSIADPANWMEGIVTSYGGNTLEIDVDLVGGSGTFGEWSINLAGDQGPQGPKGDKGDKGDAGPMGPGWDQWEGAWQTATAYVENDVVSNGGSSYICTSSHTSDAATAPGTGATWQTVWDLVAAKGQDGAGAGDVVGPASSTDGTIALFDGATGKLLKEGPAGSLVTGALQASANLADLTDTNAAWANLGLGFAAALDVGTGANTVAAGNDSRITGALQASNVVPAAEAQAGTSTTPRAWTAQRVAQAIAAQASPSPVGLYTGSTRDETNFPIGHTVLSNSVSDIPRNSSATVRLPSNPGNAPVPYTTAGTGSVLSGTWRCRGGEASGYILMQRVA